MNKRHCFVTDVGDAIEKLADALDPQRTKPFSGDLLDLLEWAERDVLAMRQQLSEAQVFESLWNGACEVANNSPVQVIYKLRQQFDAANTLINKYRDETTSLRQQVTLLRDVLKFYMDNGICEPFYHRVAEALSATKRKP